MQNANGSLERLLNSEEASQYLGLKKQTLEVWRILGKGPRFIRAGRVVRYRASDIQDWLDSNLIQSTGEVQT